MALLHCNQFYVSRSLKLVGSNGIDWSFYITCQWHVAFMGEKRKAYNILVGKRERKRLVGIPKRMWEHNIKIDLKEIEWEGVDWIYLAQDRNKKLTVMNIS
jgi:hypothetical protein